MNTIAWEQNGFEKASEGLNTGNVDLLAEVQRILAEKEYVQNAWLFMDNAQIHIERHSKSTSDFKESPSIYL